MSLFVLEAVPRLAQLAPRFNAHLTVRDPTSPGRAVCTFIRLGLSRLGAIASDWALIAPIFVNQSSDTRVTAFGTRRALCLGLSVGGLGVQDAVRRACSADGRIETFGAHIRLTRHLRLLILVPTPRLAVFTPVREARRSVRLAVFSRGACGTLVGPREPTRRPVSPRGAPVTLVGALKARDTGETPRGARSTRCLLAGVGTRGRGVLPFAADESLAADLSATEREGGYIPLQVLG